MPGQLELLLGREGLVEDLASLLIHEVPSGGGVLSGDSVQITGYQFLTQEERGIFALRKAMVPDAEVRSIIKTALAVEVYISLEANRPEAHFGRLGQAVVQQYFAVALSLVVRTDSYRPHSDNWYDSAVIGLDGRMHIDALAD